MKATLAPPSRSTKSSVSASAPGAGTRFISLHTPLGEFRVYQLSDGSLRSWWIEDGNEPDDPALRSARRQRDDGEEDLHPLASELRRYFKSGSADFSAVLTPDGPEFFRRCWDACRTIPRGQTRSYAWLAKAAGAGASAARAAGQAMRSNPLPVIIPCHRVVSSSGRLHGFAGRTSGPPLSLKRALLELEEAI